MVYGSGVDTVIGADQHTGPGVSILPSVQNFDELLGHWPGENEVWYQEVKGDLGDGTVASDSAVWLLEEGANVHLAEQPGTGHQSLLSELNSQTTILDALGVTAYTETDIALDPTGGDSGLMQLATKSFQRTSGS